MKNLFTGIDISKNTLDYCALDEEKVQVESKGVLDNQNLAPFPYQSGSSIRGKTKTHFMRD